MELFIFGQKDAHLVADLEATLLAEVLDAVDQLTSRPFEAQLIGHGDIQSDGQRAFVGDQPARDILRIDIYIVTEDGHRRSFDREVQLPRALDGGNLLLRELCHSSSDRLHNLAIAWAELLEVGLDTLDQHAFAVGDELQFLEVHLAEDEGHDRKDGLMIGLVDDGDHQTLQGLTHLDIDLTAQS